jgi:hypothetical protein
VLSIAAVALTLGAEDGRRTVRLLLAGLLAELAELMDIGESRTVRLVADGKVREWRSISNSCVLQADLREGRAEFTPSYVSIEGGYLNSTIFRTASPADEASRAK